VSDGRTFGALVPLVSGPYFGAVLAGIAAQATARGGRSLAIQTLDAALGDDYAGAPVMVEPTAWNLVDGLIVITNAADDAYLRAFQATGKPVVLLSHTVPGLNAPTVSPDNRSGIDEAVAHLVEHGHSRIAFAGFPAQSDLHERYEAYRAAMAAHGLEPTADLFYDTGNSMESGGLAAGRAMLAAGLPSTAVIAGNDLNAIGIMKALRAGGVRLPRGQAVIGFDDTTPAQYQRPSLTTVNQHVGRVGALAVDLVDRMLSGDQVEPTRHIVRSSLIARGSCGCAPGGARTGGRRGSTAQIAPFPRGGDAVAPIADALLGALEDGDSPSLELRNAVLALAEIFVAEADDAIALMATEVEPAPDAAPHQARPQADAVTTSAAAQQARPQADAVTTSADAARSAELLAAVEAVHAALPRGESGAAVTAVLQRAARRLCARTPGTVLRESLDAVIREVALDFGAARASAEMLTSAHLQQALRAEYDLSMGLLRRRADAPESLDWLANSPVSAACLALWTSDELGNRELEIVSTFGDVTARPGMTCAADFPPPALLESVADHPGSQAAVLAVKTDENDWGLLALVGPPEFRTLTGRERYFEWAAMLGGALDYQVMVDSLRRQREDLALAYDRERALTDTIRSSEERYALAAAAANDGLWDWDLSTGSVYYSPRWKSLIGHTDEEVGSSPDEWLSRVHPEDQAALEGLIDACRNGHADDLEHEHRLRAHDGTYRWVLCRALAIPGQRQAATRLVGSLTDITERHQLEEQLRRQALYDTLTGLPNRPLFLDRLDRAIARQLRAGTGHFAVVFLDLDGFKLVNDSLGHATGDALLQQVAGRIESGLRATDTSARLGGDEFTILLDGLTSVASVPAVVRKIQERIAAPYEIGGNTLVVTASAGVATSDVAYSAAEDVLRDADIAMYRAKSREPGSFLVFDPSMHDSVVSRLQTESRLRRAIEADELVLHYQPIVDLGTERMIGMEALIRWPQRDGRMAPPGEFLPVAEESGLIVPIGRSVIRRACQQIAAWRAQGLLTEVIPVSLNVSHREFWHPDLTDHLMRMLRANDLQSDWIVVEITEGVLMGNVPEAQRKLEELHCMGIRLHIDDFGTGYSSLEALHQFPIDALKIDRSFVSRLEADLRSRELVSTILAMANGLDIDVIAEGIENTSQQRLLMELGCPNGQGYLFSRPGPPLDITPRLRKQATLTAQLGGRFA